MVSTFLSNLLASRFKQRVSPDLNIKFIPRIDNTVYNSLREWRDKVNNNNNTIITIPVDNWSTEISEDILDQVPNDMINLEQLLKMLKERLINTIKNEDYRYSDKIKKRIKYLSVTYS